jgi:hypothetical protein
VRERSIIPVSPIFVLQGLMRDLPDFLYPPFDRTRTPILAGYTPGREVSTPQGLSVRDETGSSGDTDIGSEYTSLASLTSVE